jgi:hypothetical protein
MSKKGRQNKVSQEVANPTVSKTEAEMAKDSVDTAKQAKKTAHNQERVRAQGADTFGRSSLFCQPLAASAA